MIEDNFLPEGFKAKMRGEIGEKRAEILFPALYGDPETSLRVNVRKPTSEPLYPNMSPVPWCTSGHYLSARPSFTSNPLLHAGVFYVQDASSMVYENVVRSLVSESAVTVCDLCAAPGGKTTAIMNALPDGSVILANEFTSSRANILKENLCKYGYPDVILTNADTGRLAVMKEKFDIVAIDAPCSGEGMMRKEETARSQWSEGLIQQCVALQREIIANGIDMLKPGGYLIYSTCTFNTSEDESNAYWIAETFNLEPINTGLAGQYGIQGEVTGSIPCLRFMPGFTRGEGLFVAIFQKPDTALRQYPSLHINKKKGKKSDKTSDKYEKQAIETAKSWISGDFEILIHDGHLLALSPQTANLLDAIPKGVRIMSAGVEVGEIKGKDLIPAHSLAMSTAMEHPFPEVELATEDALRFLSKEAIVLPEGIPKGYVTVTFHGHRLGFVKNLGNRSNNIYPSEYKIRNLKIKG